MMARAKGLLTLVCRVGVALGFMVAVLLFGSVASYAAPTPPLPESGGVASAWECTDTATGATPPVTGTDCKVTAWATWPAPAVVDPGTGIVELTESQFQVIAFGLGLVLLLGGARLVGSWGGRR